MSPVFFVIGFAFCLMVLSGKYVEALIIAVLVLVLTVIDYRR